MKGKDLNKRLKQLRYKNNWEAIELAKLLDPNIPLPAWQVEFWEWHYKKWKREGMPS